MTFSAKKIQGKEAKMRGKTEKNTVSIVTGGGRGIGLASAKALAESGSDIAICSRTLGELKRAAGDIEKYGVRCFFRTVDTSDEVQVTSFVEKVQKFFGKIDILVNNAGKAFNKPFAETSSKEWHEVLSVNLDGYFYFCKAVGKYMMRERKGKIINISSVLSRFALPGRAPYSVSKAGTEALTRVIAAEWAPYNILVNAIAPGHINTEFVKDNIKKGLLKPDRMKKRACLSRIGDPEEVASLVSYLASDKSSYITGQTFFVDGGFSIKK